MGCTCSKASSDKIRETAFHPEGTYIKIQAVLELDAIVPNPRKRSRSVKSDGNRNKRRECNNLLNSQNENKKLLRSHSSNSHKLLNGPHKLSVEERIYAKYRVKALIGKGTYSRVLRVENRLTRQPYAMKIMDSTEEIFEAELAVLQQVNHPNIVKLAELFDTESKVYMIMELATGGNILDRLETKGCMSEDEARSMLKMVLSGLKYLHSLGITHRDLKLDNLLYYHPGEDSKVMIADFGLANTRRKNGDEYMHTICGTPQYIAPEIVSRRPYTCAVDMWAIGVIAYIVLFGAFPFHGEHNAQIFKLILQGKIDTSQAKWKKLAIETKSFILRNIQVDTSRRLTAEKAFHHRWILSPQLTYSPRHQKSPEQQRQRQSRRSARSEGSSRSGNSISSLRSGHRRVQVQHLEALSSDPEIAALM